MTRRIFTTLGCIAALTFSLGLGLGSAYPWRPSALRGKLVDIMRVLGLVASPTEQDYQSAFMTYEYRSEGIFIDQHRTTSLSIHSDGTVTIDDAPHGLPAKRLLYKMPQQQVRELVDAFYRIEYFSLDEAYETKRVGLSVSHVSDIDTVITSISTHSREKRVRTYWGAPHELSDLEKLIACTVLEPGLRDGVELAHAAERAQLGFVCYP